MAFQQYFTPDVLSFKDNRTFMELNNAEEYKLRMKI